LHHPIASSASPAAGWRGYAITVVAALFAHLAWAALCLSFLIITDSAPAGGAVDSTLPDG